MTFQERIKRALQEAQSAFWGEIASSFPEITSGDFPPDAATTFDKACENAVNVWLENQ